MGSVVKSIGNAVSNVAKGVVKAVTAPVNLVSDIVQGKNVLESVAQRTTEAVTGSYGGFAETVKGVNAISGGKLEAAPLVGSVVRLSNTASDVNAYSGKEILTPERAISSAKDLGVVGGSLLGGYLAAPLVGTSVTTATLGSGALLSGNIGGALSSIPGLAEYVPSEVVDVAKEVASSVASTALTPKPSAPSTAKEAQSTAAPIPGKTDLGIPMVIAIGAVALLASKK